MRFQNFCFIFLPFFVFGKFQVPPHGVGGKTLASTETKNYFKCGDHDYQLQKSENKNILFVGKSRSGKSTTIEVLKNPKHVAEFFGFYAGTKTARLETFLLQVKNQNFNIAIMDTPGLFEMQKLVIEQRDKDEILKIINRCIENEFTKIHQVFFVFNLAAGLIDQDILAFKEFHELFLGMEDKMSVILTFSEDYSEEFQKHLLKELRTAPILTDLNNAVQDRIFFLGSMSKTKNHKHEKILTTVECQREKLLTFITTLQSHYDVKCLPIYRNHTKLYEKMITDASLKNSNNEYTSLISLLRAFVQNTPECPEEKKNFEKHPDL